MYLFAFGNRRQPCISVKHVLKCSNAICEWPELSISIKSVVLYCIVLDFRDFAKEVFFLCKADLVSNMRVKESMLLK